MKGFQQQLYLVTQKASKFINKRLAENGQYPLTLKTIGDLTFITDSDSLEAIEEEDSNGTGFRRFAVLEVDSPTSIKVLPLSCLDHGYDEEEMKDCIEDRPINQLSNDNTCLLADLIEKATKIS